MRRRNPVTLSRRNSPAGYAARARNMKICIFRFTRVDATMHDHVGDRETVAA